MAQQHVATNVGDEAQQSPNGVAIAGASGTFTAAHLKAAVLRADGKGEMLKKKRQQLRENRWRRGEMVVSDRMASDVRMRHAFSQVSAAWAIPQHQREFDRRLATLFHSDELGGPKVKRTITPSPTETRAWRGSGVQVRAERLSGLAVAQAGVKLLQGINESFEGSGPAAALQWP
eukprot:CAMPEP_0117586162 /NCGR_PEP_ID=MMETSP0784-20121206/68562_1 /TAXON_ID=39447 /ORGANISM="" /LENGTH=174 /DNA_ID=CAMNT_0005387219 /DNA_START=23 /DNA_END=545 /DNA_ORIENTATION=+